MKWLNDYRMRLMFVGCVAAIVFGGGSARADFTFGEPTNMGPTVNSAYRENQPSISFDRLSLYFGSDRPGTSGERDIWVTTRATIDDDWGTPVNLGPPVNSPFFDSNPYISPDGLEFYFISKSRPGGFGYDDIWVSSREGKDDVWGDPVNLGSSINTWAADYGPKLSADGLELYFNSTGHGGFGGHDIFVAKRATVTDDWGAPVNLGPVVNGPSHDVHPTISTDGLCLIFSEHGSAGPYRPGGFGGADIWITTKQTTERNPEDYWNEPQNLGSTINGSSVDSTPYISPDGSILYFSSSRPGGFGDRDLWQAPIIPIVDLNGDGNIDTDDLLIMIDNWGSSETLCDIGPMPWGDGVVDIEDLTVFIEYWEQENMPEVPEEE